MLNVYFQKTDFNWFITTELQAFILVGKSIVVVRQGDNLINEHHIS